MTDTPHSLLHVTGTPSRLGQGLVNQQQAALDFLRAGNPQHNGAQDGPMTAEHSLMLQQIAAKQSGK